MLLPGWVARQRHRVLAPALLIGGVGLPTALLVRVVLSGRSWMALGLDSNVMTVVAWTTGLALLARVISVIEVWHARQWVRQWSWTGAVSVAVVVSTWAMLGFGVVEASRARSSVERAFSEPLTEPLYDATQSDDDVDTATESTPEPVVTAAAVEVPNGSTVADSTAPSRSRAAGHIVEAFIDEVSTTLPPSKPDRPMSGIDPAAYSDVATILLIGGDSGPGRWSMRSDSMMLLSIHRPSGRASLVSIPRNLERLLFPVGSAMEARYPHGFTDLANAVYPIVQSNSGLRSAYSGVGDVEPGVVALAEGIGYSLDVTIDDYVLVDMRGFVDLVDAVGGVTVEVPQAVLMPGNIPGAPTQYPDVIGPGLIFMDGTTALGYARSRSMDSDYQRTERQRHLLAAMGSQFTLGDILTSYGAIVDTLGSALRTSLSPDELADIVAVIGGETAIVESVGLVPPLVTPRRPDWSRLARISAEVRVALATGIPSGW
ncbi:MAG TPA: LCP family protein [Ilumatobacter sp.]|nr:LCP family protein [Ilumatobacter sp.]